jgi:glycyl-tRNA synthetase beta chain
MDTGDCLIELGTEELPPRALKSLSQNFAELVRQALEDNDLKPAAVKVFATPRRLAMLLLEVPLQQSVRKIEKRGPAIQAAFDSEGQPSKAALGFARSCGVNIEKLTRNKTDKGEWLYFEKEEAGLALQLVLPDMVNQAIAKLPIPKRMRWGAGLVEFVRPVKWLVMMIGSELVEGKVLGVNSGTESFGHRFHAPGAITISKALDYESLLETNGWVIADFERRKSMIRDLVETAASELGGVVSIENSLLEEVTALVEHPVVVCGEFDKAFLEIPQEALVMTMQDNQKYFAVFDRQNRLMPHFITIANIDSSDPGIVARGNERVIRPRFSDAGFFYQQDQKHSLASLRPALDSVVFQEKLGSVGDKSNRIVKLAGYIAAQLNADRQQVERAAELCKCDLLTEMVGEFPKLQGIMGCRYARIDGETETVSAALEQHYWPRYAGDDLPESDVGQCLALADRLDSLVGIFAIGQKPSGVKDPFALRRAALAVVRILIEKSLPLDLADLCAKAGQGLAEKVDASSVEDKVIDYVFDRLRAYYQDQEIGFDVVDAVAFDKPTQLFDCDRRIQALQQFQTNDAAISLAAANKRIANILKKQDFETTTEVDQSLFEFKAEKDLFEMLTALQGRVDPMFADGKYLQGLTELAALRPEVDQFFDEVMVMVDDELVRNNRLALLNKLYRCFRQIADFSRIQS